MRAKVGPLSSRGCGAGHPAGPPSRSGLRNAELSAQEHSVAKSLQRAVLPEHLPELNGLQLDATYLPATAGLSVGGDFCDAFQLGRRLVGLVIGDVVGHDIHSASIMGQLRNGLRMLAALDPDPTAVLAGTQQALLRLLPDALATVFYAVLDVGTGELVFANAGHPGPLVVTGSMGTFLDEPFGPLLGSTPDATFPLGRHRLEPGSTLLLYTDGLIEDRDRHLDVELGELLRAATSAPDAGKPLAQQVISSLLDTRSRADDVCVMTARLTGQ